MRLFDTELFNQEWFGELSPRLKLLYIYVLMKCDCAGVLELNLRRFTFDINCPDSPVTREEIFNSFGKRILPVGGTAQDASKAIIPDYIRFHYGPRLINDRRHNIHRAVVKRIKSVGLSLEYVCEMATKKFEYDNFDDVTPTTEVKQAESPSMEKKTEKAEKPKRQPFVKPTLDEVKAYFKEKGTSIDPEEFWSKYESVGWVDKNGNRIKDWKRCLVTWERFRKTGGGTAKPSRVVKADNWRGGSASMASEANDVL